MQGATTAACNSLGWVRCHAWTARSRMMQKLCLLLAVLPVLGGASHCNKWHARSCRSLSSVCCLFLLCCPEGLLLRCAVYLSMYYSFSQPRAVLWQMYMVTCAIYYACTGMAYVLSQVRLVAGHNSQQALGCLPANSNQHQCLCHWLPWG